MIELPEGFIVTEASELESYNILAEKQLIKHLPIAGVSELADYTAEHKHTFYLASFRGYSLLFFFFEHSSSKHGGIYDLHIACPKNSIRASRVLAICTAKWIAKIGAPDAQMLVTRCPEGSIANMCTKLGGHIIYKNEDTGEVEISILTEELHY